MNKDASDDVYTLRDILGQSVDEQKAYLKLKQDPQSYQIFLGFPRTEQEKILHFMQGNKGLKILYDNIFKKILSPEYHPQRLEHFLSVLLQQKIHIHSVLSSEGSQMADTGSFVIMDILVELEDQSIINLEMQKIGYKFTGERSNCYLSDLIMRQYNRIKSERGILFTYRDMKPVFLIVLMEQSPREFQKVSPHFIHRQKYSFDTNVQIPMLSNLIYVSLDTFHKVVQNIDTELKAWLTFLSSDEPSDIVKLVNDYPEFKQYYQEIIEFRTNPKELIGMFSEALAILDRNTERYMIDEWKKEEEELKKENERLKKEGEELRKEGEELRKEGEELRKEGEELRKEGEKLRKEGEELRKEGEELRREGRELNLEIEMLKAEIERLKALK